MSGTHVHDGGLYASDDEFLQLIVPFVEEGRAAGEAVITGYDDRKSSILREALGACDDVSFLEHRALYSTPSRAVESSLRLLRTCLDSGARAVRVAGDVPHPGNGGSFDGWDRYEAGIDVLWDGYPVRSLCLYDRRTAPDEVLDVVERTHRHICTVEDGRRSNPRFVELDRFEPLAVASDPLERTEPLVELLDPTPSETRRSVVSHLGSEVDRDSVDAIALAMSELVTNAHMHGTPPVVVRMWRDGSGSVLTVHDTSAGPSDPLAGLHASGRRDEGGRGLWIAHQLCDDIALRPDDSGFTVRIRFTAGAHVDRPWIQRGSGA